MQPESDSDLPTPASKAPAARRENIGHRLRSPLHTILGYAGLLQAEASAETRQQLGIIEASARELLASIDALPESIRNLPFEAPLPIRPPVSAATAPLPVLPETERPMLRGLLQLGRLLEIERWAAGLGQRLPQHADTARQIQALARAANLPALQQLLDQGETGDDL